MGELDKTVNQSNDTSVLDNSNSNSLSWGRLLSINPAFFHVEIQDDECLFGRSPQCNVTFTDKKISSKHCRIYRIKEEGNVDYRFYLEDYSSNGTFVNRKRVGKGNTVPIVNGNEISLTANIESNDPTRIVYTFQDLEKLRREEQEEKENRESGYTQVDDQLQNELLQMSPIKKTPSNLDKDIDSNNNNNNNNETNNTNNDCNNNNNNITPIKRTTSTTTASSISSTSTSDIQQQQQQQEQQEQQQEQEEKVKESKKVEDEPIKKQTSNISTKLKRKSSDLDDLEQDPTNTRKLKLDETNPSLTTSKDKESNDNKDTTVPLTATNDKKDDEEMKDKEENKLNKSNDSSSVITPTKTTNATTPLKKKEEDLEESIGENLICGICQDIIYKCLTLIPCMHNFCVCCYGDWRAGSVECPQCRQVVKSAQKNHAINNLIELYLKKNPEKARDQEELKSMDQRCKITDEMLKNGLLNKSKKEYYNDEEDDEYYSDYSDEEDDDDYQPPKCPYCPPNPPHASGYQCQAQAPLHQYCTYCHDLMPIQNPEPPGVKCDQCKRSFCNYYKPCRNGNRFGKMIDLPIHIIPFTTFGGNQFEIKILNDYLTKNNKSVNQLYKDLLNDINNKKLVIPANSNINMPQDPIIDAIRCYDCASGFFSRALFYYRMDIPKDQLPDYAVREKCYFGSACRTQHNKFDHAKKLDHVCYQTKFN